MANSTFSGPVRSQNGFQELVDGVWVPVGGGGGGSAAVVVYRSAVAQEIVLPVPTEVGQVYRYIFPPTLDGDGESVTLVTPPVPGADASRLNGYGALYNLITGTSLVIAGPSGSGANAVRVLAETSDISAEIQIVYNGTEPGGDAKFSVVGASWWTGDISTNRIFSFS